MFVSLSPHCAPFRYSMEPGAELTTIFSLSSALSAVGVGTSNWMFLRLGEVTLGWGADRLNVSSGVVVPQPESSKPKRIDTEAVRRRARRDFISIRPALEINDASSRHTEVHFPDRQR